MRSGNDSGDGSDHNANGTGGPFGTTAETLAAAEGQASRILADDWARTVDRGKPALTDEAERTYFELGRRCGELAVDPGRAIMALKRRLDLLARSEVTNRRADLSSVKTRLGLVLGQRIPDLVDRREALRESLPKPDNDGPDRHWLVWGVELVLFAALSVMPLMAEFALAKDVTEFGLLIRNPILFALALAAATMAFKILADDIFKLGDKRSPWRQEKARGIYLGVLICLWLALMWPVTALRTQQILENDREAEALLEQAYGNDGGGNDGASSADIVGKGATPQWIGEATGLPVGIDEATGLPVADPLGDPAPPPLAGGAPAVPLPTVIEGVAVSPDDGPMLEDPRRTRMQWSFYLAAILFPMLSGVGLSRTLFLLGGLVDSWGNGKRALRRRRHVEREIEGVDQRFEREIDSLVRNARDRALILLTLGAREREMRRAIRDVRAAVMEMPGMASEAVEQAARDALTTLDDDAIDELHAEASNLLGQPDVPTQVRMQVTYNLAVLEATLEAQDSDTLEVLRNALADLVEQRVLMGATVGEESGLEILSTMNKEQLLWMAELRDYRRRQGSSRGPTGKGETKPS